MDDDDTDYENDENDENDDDDNDESDEKEDNVKHLNKKFGSKLHIETEYLAQDQKSIDLEREKDEEMFSMPFPETFWHVEEQGFTIDIGNYSPIV